jgi:hypothetical protein
MVLDARLVKLNSGQILATSPAGLSVDGASGTSPVLVGHVVPIHQTPS